MKRMREHTWVSPLVFQASLDTNGVSNSEFTEVLDTYTLHLLVRIGKEWTNSYPQQLEEAFPPGRKRIVVLTF